MITDGIEIGRIFAGHNHSPLVYFIRIGNRVKIGTTTNLRRRVNDLSLTLGEVAKVVPGGADVEKVFHERFRAYRIHHNREWFDARGPLAVFLSDSFVDRGAASVNRAVRPSPQAAQPNPRSEIALEPRPGITVAEACRIGLLPASADAVRQALSRARRANLPAPKLLPKGGYNAAELAEWWTSARPNDVEAFR
jgi:hypothetical protein